MLQVISAKCFHRLLSGVGFHASAAYGRLHWEPDLRTVDRSTTVAQGLAHDEVGGVTQRAVVATCPEGI